MTAAAATQIDFDVAHVTFQLGHDIATATGISGDIYQSYDAGTVPGDLLQIELTSPAAEDFMAAPDVLGAAAIAELDARALYTHDGETVTMSVRAGLPVAGHLRDELGRIYDFAGIRITVAA